MPMDLITILIAYTAVVLTVVGGILTFLLYHFLPVKSRTDTMWRDLYGNGGEGELEEAGDERENMREMLREAQAEHRMQSAQMARMTEYLDDLSDHLGDGAPDPYDGNYLEPPEEGDKWRADGGGDRP